MTGFDVTVFVVVGALASFGFMRGFVQESISLLAWVVSMVAIRTLHGTLADVLAGHVGTASGASVLAFLLLAIVPYAAVRFIARYMGNASRTSMLGPVDRVLGFGFGAVKGTVLVVMGFSVLVLAYDTIWGAGGRPKWITASRTYPFINASSEELVRLISERRRAAREAAQEDGASSADTTSDVPPPRKRHKAD
ncbi:CvpA family protein [Novosphingobium sp. FSY-8]|uniref:CvpA family protein n=1 Tax=Novosphingobium ovatum TaxID=1908523 RepID=A0ABW9XCK8_9SPHN|nr:CvpA family protein [Novosphingobium ovatum]NBC36271.1 CvpA family protein [Novosphingobium ovatum]